MLRIFIEICKISQVFLQIQQNSARLFCRSRKMLKNEYLDAKIGVDTAENELWKEWCVLADRGSKGPTPPEWGPQRSAAPTRRCSRRSALQPQAGLKDTVVPGPYHSNHCDQNSVRNHQNFARILSEFVRNPENWWILIIVYGIWRNSERCSSNSVQNLMKIVKNIRILDDILKIAKTFRGEFAKILNWERCEGMIFL